MRSVNSLPFFQLEQFPIYLPYGANIALRELGMLLFLAAVGLKVGPGFFEALLSAQGLVWVCCGLLVTVLPLLAVLIPYRRKVSYLLL